LLTVFSAGTVPEHEIEETAEETEEGQAWGPYASSNNSSRHPFTKVGTSHRNLCFVSRPRRSSIQFSAQAPGIVTKVYHGFHQFSQETAGRSLEYSVILPSLAFTVFVPQSTEQKALGAWEAPGSYPAWGLAVLTDFCTVFLTLWKQ
jgi:hypothetical protein